MTVCILLAAGSSSRMKGITNMPDLHIDPGQSDVPKMLLPFKGKTFLQHAIDEIKNSTADELLVVTGCYHAVLEPLLASQQIAIAENKNWATGMGGSISTGIDFIEKNFAGASSVLLLVCDQPFISAALLNEMIKTAHQSKKGIVAAAYKNTVGTPVLFHKKYFPLLLALNVCSGAKQIVQQFANDTATVVFAGGETDIDTAEDYRALE